VRISEIFKGIKSFMLQFTYMIKRNYSTNGAISRNKVCACIE